MSCLEAAVKGEDRNNPIVLYMLAIALREHWRNEDLDGKDMMEGQNCGGALQRFKSSIAALSAGRKQDDGKLRSYQTLLKSLECARLLLDMETEKPELVKLRTSIAMYRNSLFSNSDRNLRRVEPTNMGPLPNSPAETNGSADSIVAALQKVSTSHEAIQSVAPPTVQAVEKPNYPPRVSSAISPQSPKSNDNEQELQRKPSKLGKFVKNLSRTFSPDSDTSAALSSPPIPSVEQATLSEDIKALVKSVLPLPLLELGYCEFYGWGIKKDRGKSVKHFYIAALLGDTEAQAHLAFMFENGRGVKRNMKLASKFYRMYIQSSHSDGLGMSWIYDPKLSVFPVEAPEEAFKLAIAKLNEL